jgi:hypothetical protein
MKNLPPPYEISQGDGFSHFQTDHKLTYVFRFNDLTQRLPPMLGIYDIQVFDFEFFPYDPEPEVKKPHDPRVSSTLLDAVRRFFENECNVLIYLCDANDGRPRERQALFSRWYGNISDIADHELVTIAIGNEKVYGGVFTRTDFPYPEVLRVELVDKAGGFILEKFGR